MKLFKKKEDKKIWKITDTIIKIENIVFNQHPDFGERFDINEPFVCIRNFHLTCIYIKEDQFEKFKKISEIYDEKQQLINLTNLIPYTKYQDCYALVAHRTTPIQASIRELHYCNIDNIDIYVTRSIRLVPEDQLFKDLINLQMFKDKYKLN